jgi:pimeloyl-ACP methyl ester carboxylesterase
VNGGRRCPRCFISTEWSFKDRDYLVFVPDGAVVGLTVAFHPFGSSPELVLDGERPGSYLIRELEGLRAPAQALGYALLLPRSRGRVTPAISLAWEPHLDGAWDAARRMRDDLGLTRIDSGGLSMGGMEALAFAARHPEEIGSVWAANPIIDLAHWYRDRVEANTGGNPEERAALDVIAAELGGDPDSVPDEYARRSPICHASELARTRVRLVWSPADTVIPNQATAHAHRLAGLLAQEGGDVTEVVVTHEPADPAMDPGRFAHEACDVWEAMGWVASAPNLNQ